MSAAFVISLCALSAIAAIVVYHVAASMIAAFGDERGPPDVVVNRALAVANVIALAAWIVVAAWGAR